MTRCDMPRGEMTHESGEGSRAYRAAECIILFALLPGLFLTPLSRPLVLAATGLGILYAIFQGTRCRIIPLRRWGLNGFRSVGGILVPFLLFATGSTTAVALLLPDQLFAVVRRNPALWIFILFVYCLFSVYPQTLLFRAFFLERYRSLFSRRSCLILANALLFSWAHNLIANPLVYPLTFFGAILFCRTWFRSKSVAAVAIEHALYGFWLFTVGLGSYFAFPGG